MKSIAEYAKRAAVVAAKKARRLEKRKRRQAEWEARRQLFMFTGLKTKCVGRTYGNGPDVGYVYSGDTAPWDDSLHDYRPFNDREMQAQEICFRTPRITSTTTQQRSI
jgi:hypothetical protein